MPKYEFMRKKATKFYPKQRGLVAEEAAAAAEALVWIESDSDDEQTEQADFAVADFEEEVDVSFMALDDEPTYPAFANSALSIKPINLFQDWSDSGSEQEEDEEKKDQLPTADNPHGYILHNYSGALYGQSGRSRIRSQVTRTSEPVTPIKPPNKSPSYTPTKNSVTPPRSQSMLTNLSTTVSPPRKPKAESKSSNKHSASHSIPEPNSEYTLEEMADVMNKMYNDFEELKEVHNVLSDDFKKVSTENFGLKAELMLLSGFQEEFEALKSENLSLAEKVNVCVAQIGDLVSRNKNLENIVNTFSKPQAAVKAINATQSVQLNKSGVGYSASRKSHAAETSRKNSDVSGNEYSPKELLNDSREKAFNAIPLVYPSPKNQTKETGRNKQSLKAAEIRIADTNARNSKVKAALTDSSSSSDYSFDICADDTRQADVKKTVKNRNRRSKLKKVQFVPAQSPSPSAPQLVDEENSADHQEAFSKCQLCYDFGHLAHECLLGFISASKEVKPSNGNMIWLPKNH